MVTAVTGAVTVGKKPCAHVVLEMVFSLFTILLALLWLVILSARKDRYVPTHYDHTF
jgi:hypothetical protein